MRFRFNRRSEALLCFAALDYVYAYSLFNPPAPLTPQHAWMQSILPLWLWGALWLVVAVLCTVCAFVVHDSVAFAGAVAIKVAWGLLNFFGWLADAFPTGYVSAAIWMVFAWFVFRVAGGIPPPYKPNGERAWTQS